MSNLQSHAIRELKLLGYEFDDDGMPVQSEDGFDINAEMCLCLMELIEVFEKQEHSGASAGYLISLLKDLMSFTPLSPLTGEDHEWNDMSMYGGDGETDWQNNRCSHVFKRADGTCYDINGKVFIDPDGCSYTNRDSFVEVTFPYKPETVTVYVDGEGNPIEEVEDGR